MTRWHVATILAAAGCLVLSASALRAQSSINSDAGLFMGGVEVRLSAPGVDSTQWYQAHVVFVHGDCTWFALDHAGWQRHHLVRRAKVPSRERVVVPLRSVIAFRVGAFSVNSGKPDSTAWTTISADSVRAKEPRGCLRK